MNDDGAMYRCHDCDAYLSSGRYRLCDDCYRQETQEETETEDTE